jgi:hypothetical protein
MFYRGQSLRLRISERQAVAVERRSARHMRWLIGVRSIVDPRPGLELVVTTSAGREFAPSDGRTILVPGNAGNTLHGLRDRNRNCGFP